MPKSIINEEERIAWVAERLGLGKVAVKEYKEVWHRGEAAFYRDRRKAIALMREHMSKSAEEWREDLIQRYEELYARTLTDPRNRGVALSTLNALAHITGNDVQKVEVEGKENFSIKWEKEAPEEE